MLIPLIIAALLSALCSTATARMVPPWAKDLPNWKHYKIPMHHPTRDIPQHHGVLPPTYDSPTEPEVVPDSECPTVCVDAINECGMRYGDCLPVCPGEKPALIVPECPSATTGAVPAAYSV